MNLHIFSASALVARIEDNKGEKNLYQNVNNLLKGSKQGSPKLISELIKIIEDENRLTVDNLKTVLQNMQALQDRQSVNEGATVNAS